MTTRDENDTIISLRGRLNELGQTLDKQTREYVQLQTTIDQWRRRLTEAHTMIQKMNDIRWMAERANDVKRHRKLQAELKQLEGMMRGFITKG